MRGGKQRARKIKERDVKIKVTQTTQESTMEKLVITETVY